MVGHARHILKSFNATGKITVAASFLTDVDDIEDSQKKVALDKTKARLEKLEEDAGEGDRMQVSQKEYVRRIEGLHSELAEAWQNSERVQALKITIQCAKLLQDTSMIQFYPSMFVMLTEIRKFLYSLPNRIIHRWLPCVLHSTKLSHFHHELTFA